MTTGIEVVTPGVCRCGPGPCIGPERLLAGWRCARQGVVGRAADVPVPLPLMPDSSDRDIALSKAKRIQGWYVDRSLVPDDPVSQAMPTWIEFVKRNPDATLPNGVGGAIVAFYEGKRGSG